MTSRVYRRLLLVFGAIVLMVLCAYLGARFAPSLKSALVTSRNVLVERGAGQPEPYFGDWPSLAALNLRDAALEEIHRGLDYPWAFEFLSPRQLLITEFAGRVLLLNLDSGALLDVGRIDALSASAGKGQIGLMDVALHPQFADNGWVYFSHAIDSAEQVGAYALAVTRARLSEGALSDEQVLFVATPFHDSPSNFGGALAFDQDSRLFIATGDRSLRDNAQKTRLLTGKIIRLNDDGSVPADNPFVGASNVDERIYAFGVRNPQGLAFDPGAGTLYSTEHGPMGGDEVNRIVAGGNYGWPVITYGANYTTQKIGVGSAFPGLLQPLYYYLPSPAISPLHVYSGDMFDEWRGDLLVGALKLQFLSRLDLVEGRVLSEQRLAVEAKGRFRDIKEAADGSLYLLLQDEGRILRLYRDAALVANLAREGRDIYRMACATCHDKGMGSVAPLSDHAAWAARVRAGREKLYASVLQGRGDMPARGFCDDCTDDEIRKAVDFMFDKVQR